MVQAASGKKAVVVYAGFISNAGGVVTHTKLLRRALELLGFEVQIQSLETLPLLARYLPHMAWHLLRPIDGVLAIFAKQKLISFLLKSFRPKADAFFFQDIYVAARCDVPSLIHLHALWSDNLQSLRSSRLTRDFLASWEAKLIRSATTRVLTVSEPYRAHVSAFLGNSVSTTALAVVEPGIDQAPFAGRLQGAAAQRDVAILYVGTLEHRKNLPLLLEVVRILNVAGVQVQLDVVGGGPLFSQLTRTVSGLGLTNSVRFHGVLGREEVAEKMRHSRLYMHTSVKESFSFSLLEAKVAGLTTIAHCSLEVPEEFVDFPVTSWDPEDWALAARAALTNSTPEFDASFYTLEAFASRICSHLKVVNVKAPFGGATGAGARS